MPATINQAKRVLVTGATAGIGRALALAIANLPHRPEVIALGRRHERLKELSEAHGLKTVQMDLDTDHLSIKTFSEDLLRRFPEMSYLRFPHTASCTCHDDISQTKLNAGVQHEFDLTKEFDLAKVTSELNTNYTSTVSLISYLMPHFSKLSAQGRECFFIPITSALNVLEIIPPRLVESELHDRYGTTEVLSETWMALDDFFKAMIEGLQRGDTSIAIGTISMTVAKFEEGKLDLVKRIYRNFPKKTGLGVPAEASKKLHNTSM